MLLVFAVLGWLCRRAVSRPAGDTRRQGPRSHRHRGRPEQPPLLQGRALGRKQLRAVRLELPGPREPRRHRGPRRRWCMSLLDPMPVLGFARSV